MALPLLAGMFSGGGGGGMLGGGKSSTSSSAESSTGPVNFGPVNISGGRNSNYWPWIIGGLAIIVAAFIWYRTRK